MESTLELLPLLLLAATTPAAELAKNIVLTLADDLGWGDTTLDGKPPLYETPNIERLAVRGMTYPSAHASPICSPTGASIMTDQNPARHGLAAPVAHQLTVTGMQHYGIHNERGKEAQQLANRSQPSSRVWQASR